MSWRIRPRAKHVMRCPDKPHGAARVVQRRIPAKHACSVGSSGYRAREPLAELQHCAYGGPYLRQQGP
eukprot:3596442-Rhodomonas_salina.5